MNVNFYFIVLNAVVYGIFAGETGAYIERSELTRFLLETDGPTLPSSLSLLFTEGEVWQVCVRQSKFDFWQARQLILSSSQPG